MLPEPSPTSCEILLERYRNARGASAGCSGDLLHFPGIDDRDVYNITAPFSWRGDTYLLGRVERRDSEHSDIWFFRRSGDAWEPLPDVPPFTGLQDPCITCIDDELVLGGVRYPVNLPDGTQGWRMEFFRGHSPATLRHFFNGPDKMKDIRFKQLPDGRVAVFSRPQGMVGGRGKIGFATARGLDHLSIRLIEEAPLFSHFFLDSEWGGANEVHLLANGHLGVLGHIACFDAQNHRHYYPMVFSVDPDTGAASELHIIAERDDFPPGPSKRPDLVDVIFSGGVVRKPSGRAELYAGLSDASASRREIADPFVRFEVPELHAVA